MRNYAVLKVTGSGYFPTRGFLISCIIYIIDMWSSSRWRQSPLVFAAMSHPALVVNSVHLLPPASAVEVIKMEPSVCECVSVCVCLSVC